MRRVCRLQVRYAAVRRQTAAHAGELEVQVLDYQNTAADLLPLLAQAYALFFMVLPQPTQSEQYSSSLSCLADLNSVIPVPVKEKPSVPMRRLC